ncbi:MAG: tetratricopeptide repeat protein [Deltaproteobacteria bacterium]|nr:tetratricopeptide repeat protein [Deltaproteobacteria bacterium]
MRKDKLRAQVRWRVLGVILALALFLTGCATNKAFREKQSRAFRDRGERYLGANQPSKALEQFFEALKIYPDDPYLHYDLAYTYDMKGMLDKTEYHLKEAIRLKPDYSDAYNYLGFIYFGRGKVEEAIKYYHKALENELYMNPESAHNNLGLAYLRLKEYHKAMLHLEEAVRLVPDYAIAYNNLGKAYEGLGQYDKARFSYEQAVQFNPQYAEAYLNLGKLLYRSGESNRARWSFSQVIRSEPGSEIAMEAQRYLKRLQ